TGQCPSEAYHLEGHNLKGADSGGLLSAQCPLQEKVGVPEALDLEDGSGPSWKFPPTWTGCVPQAAPPLMGSILVVAYPELHGQLRAHKQLQG
ncbi:hypothetical protein NDU88_002350, partial [Pleurodeles waltl]